MKGIVFTEFLEMVEEKFGLETEDKILRKAGVEGSYTSVGTYDHNELVQLVVSLSKEICVPVPDLVKSFGRHLFKKFSKAYPHFFKTDSAFQFLEKIETYIHVEVRKLYPEAELPHFDTSYLSTQEFELIYTSPRPFADLAEGLIEGCAEYFQEEIKLDRENIRTESPYKTRFLLTKV